MIDIARVPITRVRRVYNEVEQRILQHNRRPEIRNAAREIIALGGDPSKQYDYINPSTGYIGIEVAMRLLFPNGLSSITGLQVASNYGSFLHYLKNEQHITGITGIDLNTHAVAYGRQIGSPVSLGDAANLQQAAESLDVVITRHFLDPDYLRDPVWVFREQILKVLKPGAFHLSCLEAETWSRYEPSSAWFLEQTFSAEARELFWLARIKIFQKPV